MNRQKLSWLILFFLIFLSLGYFREFFFVHMNNIMYMKYYNQTSTLTVPPVMTFFENFSYNTLYYSKYAYTLIWTAIFFFANYFALKKLTHNKLFLKILVYAYLLMLTISFLSMAYAYFVKSNLQTDEYTLSRWLMGIAQSPLICLILLASENLYKKSVQEK